MSNFTFDYDLFSDLHKDAYGFRPRAYHRFYADDTTDVERQEFWDWAIRDLDIRIEEEAKAEAEAIASFEKAIADSMEIANCDRSTAIRYQLEAMDMLNEYDPGYICYTLGLPYFKGYEEEFLNHLRDPEEDLAMTQMEEYGMYGDAA
jgi:hypothetical protein